MANKPTNNGSNGTIQKSEKIDTIPLEAQLNQTDNFTQSVIKYAAIGTGFSPDRIVEMILNDWANNENRDSQWLREKSAIAARAELERDRVQRENLMAIASLTSGIV
ncbi:MAG: hypothetical protein J7647_22315 [Cyanobacteria bacterium SBLK]|nr:hypothetical protein [Cyanobacteria bacterium SBLK]